MSKRRRALFLEKRPSETHVKVGVRVGHVDKLPPKEFVEKLGRNDLCPCGSRKRFKRCCLKRAGFDGSLRDHYFRDK